jgi:hypothetical protein
MATFDRERALQQLKVFSPDSVGARIAHITDGFLPTNQITVNRDLILDEKKVAFDRIIKNDNPAVLEVKFKNVLSSYFLLNYHDYLIYLCYFQEGHGIGPAKEFFFQFYRKKFKVSI